MVITAPGYFFFKAAVTGAGKDAILITVSVSTQLPSNPKLADTFVPLSLNSASYSLVFSFPHFTLVALGYLVLNADLTAAGTFIDWQFDDRPIAIAGSSTRKIFFIVSEINRLIK